MQKPGEAVTDSTIFEAASLTKIVTAYAALQLVDQGKLNLDTPLNKYLGNNYDCGNDQRINLITARHVLTHSSGFPNWRPEGSAHFTDPFQSWRKIQLFR
jgi:CubicO group peptidase (beta-lactamase class C family)